MYIPDIYTYGVFKIFFGIEFKKWAPGDQALFGVSWYSCSFSSIFHVLLLTERSVVLPHMRK
jgi:uncharacterized membrane protein